ncbi:MAG: HEAT repeat domain-containing protein [Betaproteobacteria bacterium]
MKNHRGFSSFVLPVLASSLMLCSALASAITLPRDGWASWQVPAVDNAPNWCCFGDGWSGGKTPDVLRGTCQLDEKDYGYGTHGRNETTEQMRIYARFAGGKLERVRALSASCAVNAKTQIQDITGITADESAKWLVSVIAQDTSTQEKEKEKDKEKERGRRVGGDALAALATLRGNTARDALAGIARNDASMKNRKDAVFWLAQVRGNEGAEIITPIMFNDSEPKVREHAAFALSQTRTPKAAASLIQLGNTDRDTKVRSQAWFWLSQSRAAESENAIRAALQKETDRHVRDQAIFALSQLPEDRGARALIAVAEDKSMSREDRKKAIFWLGQMKSDSAISYLDRILMAKGKE